MFSIAGIDLLEQELLNHERTLLEILLQDKTTKKNIIWATDDYAELGEPYSFKKEILPNRQRKRAKAAQKLRGPTGRGWETGPNRFPRLLPFFPCIKGCKGLRFLL